MEHPSSPFTTQQIEDVESMFALPRGHANIANFLVMISFVSNIPANTGHWPNAGTEMTHRLQRRHLPGIGSLFCVFLDDLVHDFVPDTYSESEVFMILVTKSWWL